MIVRRRCSRHRAALAVCGVPAFGQAVKVSNDRARGDPVVVLVGVEHGRVTVPELEGRSCFPFVAEPVNAGELVDGCGVAEFVEHATAPDGLKLIGVTHQHHPPTLLIRQESELVQCGGWRSCRLRPRSAWRRRGGGSGVRVAGRSARIRVTVSPTCRSG